MEEEGELHLYFNAEIVWLHGQRLPNVSKMELKAGLQDYAWVTRDELQSLVHPNVYSVCDKMLSWI